MNQLRDKLYRFMRGRNGMDSLSKFTFLCSVLLLFFASVFNVNMLHYLAIPTLIYSYFRILSRNIPKRYEENQLFEKLKYRILHQIKWTQLKNKWMQFLHFHIYKCPSCKQKIRIPRGKGMIMVRCPKCGLEFKKRS
ncbi:MAG: hypothetical protein PHT89_03235 [Lachnospiraceae bacterium]|nr:hypothetical protein [Lachnospiraceae bacterium]